jgi:thiamine-monophosphate kinase
MTLRQLGELSLIERLKSILDSSSEDLLIGIGDDCALVRPEQEGVLLSTDSMIEGVHFRWDLFTPYQVGYRLVIRNVSDIYAMGGSPRWALLTMALPSEISIETFDGILKGIKAGCDRFGITVAGGDVSSSEKTMLSMTVLGEAQGQVLQRTTAQQGQKIYLTGPTGEAALGLYLLKVLKRPVRIEEGERLNLALDWALVEPLLRRVCLPELPGPVGPRRFQACIDISDGLSIDLWRLCEASSVGARVYRDRIPVTEEMTQVAEALGLDLWEFVLSGGEDYQLLLVGNGPEEGLYEIGEITGSGCELLGPHGQKLTLGPGQGYEHFRSGTS